MGLGDLGLSMDSDDESARLSTESSSNDNTRDVCVPLAAVPLTTLSSGESSRSQPAPTGICWTFVLALFVYFWYVVTMF